MNLRTYPGKDSTSASPPHHPATTGWALGVAILIGSALVFVLPPTQAPDEIAHFTRAFATSEGRLFLENRNGVWGQFVPGSLVEIPDWIMSRTVLDPRPRTSVAALRAAWSKPLDADRKIFFEAAPGKYTAGILPPLPYLPAAAAIRVSTFPRTSALGTLYAARLANMVAGTLLVWLAVRRTPFGKWCFALLSVMPMTLFLRSSISPDGITIGLAFLLIAEILRVSQRDGSLRARDMSAAILLAFLLQLCKPVYAPLALLVLIVPLRRFDNPIRGALALAGVCLAAAAGVVLTIWWVDLSVRSPEALPVHTAAGGPVAAPIALMAAMWEHYPSMISYYLEQFAGRLGRLDTPVPYTIRASILFAILISCFAAGESSSRLRIPDRALGFATFVACGVLVSLFFFSVGEGQPQLAGVQGRYFIPAAPALLLLLANNSLGRRFPRQAFHTIFILVALSSAIATMWAIWTRFYA